MKSLFCLFALAIPASAAISITLPGSSSVASWNNLNIANTTPVAGPHAATNGSTATFSVTSGSPLFTGSGSGIYSGFGTSATFAIKNSGISNIETLVFQARFDTAPTMVSIFLNGATDPAQALTPLYSASASTGLNSSMGSPILDMAWQFDFTSFTDPITSYELRYTLPVHAVTYASSPVSVHTSDQYTAVIPEPSSALMGLAAAGLLVSRRRRA